MVFKNRWWWKVAVAVPLAATAWGGTFGKVVSIGGQASDIALDEGRGVLYIANFTANRIEVMSLADNSIQTSINVAPQPSSIALSPDGHYLVITHFGNWTSAPPANALTVLDLTTNGEQAYALASPPLGVAFGFEGQALIVTTTDFLLFDPVLGTNQEILPISALVNTLAAPLASFPPQITNASVTASGDGMTIYGMGNSGDGTFTFRYDVQNKNVSLQGVPVKSLTTTACSAVPSLGAGVTICSTATIPGNFGPRVVSMNQDGSLAMAGWKMFEPHGRVTHQVPSHADTANIGSIAFDTNRGLVYAQIPAAGEDSSTNHILQILDQDNLAVLNRVRLPENLAGKSVLSSDGNTLYSVSDSGALVMPVGSMGRMAQIAASQQDLIFRGTSCARGVASQNLTIANPGGGATPFSISSDTNGITVSPNSGVTPMTVQVSVDPTAFQNQKGTSTGTLTLSSAAAINIPQTVRVLVNNHDPGQRGTIVDVPGALSDLMADPVRSRFYILRQDTNQLLVFDSSNNTQIAALKTGNVPKGMAITFDHRYLLVANDSSQIISVYDLETMQPANPIFIPDHTAHSIAASANAILAATTDVQNQGKIMKLDIASGTGGELKSLGVFANLMSANSAMTASPNGSSILIAAADGNILLYDANADSFVASRKDLGSLSGAYAASAYNQYVVGNNLLNSSLVRTLQLGTGGNASSGFAFVDQTGFMTTVPPTSSTTTSTLTGTGTNSVSTTTTQYSPVPGAIQRADLSTSQVGLSLATSMIEAPLLPSTTTAFTRTLAPLYNRNAIVNLTVSGFTVLPWNYDASVARPMIQSITNAADGSRAIAPGGLISIFGQQFSPVNVATQEIPLPTALADSCITVNGLPVPMLFVSPNQINAQMPFEAIGNVTLVLRTPGGNSDNFNTVVLPGAPSVFRTAIDGLGSDVPTVLRATDGEIVTDSNPVHKNDYLVIYLTGLGITNPAVPTGLPGPSDPLASAILSPAVTLGGANLPIFYAGMSPGQVGVYQINVQVPSSIQSGLSIPLTIKQSGMDTTIQVRVVD